MFRSTTLVALLAASLLALPAVAGAKGGGGNGDVLKVGSCTASSSAKLKLSPDDGRLEVEMEVDQNRNGVRWTWTFKRAGSRLAGGTAVTKAPSGSFEVRRLVSDRSGRDTIVATATRRGERCTVTASI